MATYASDGSVASIQGIHDNPATVDGDTITLPTGTFNWSTQLSITKYVKLQGNTVLHGNWDDVGGFTATDNTTIIDDCVLKDYVIDVLLAASHYSSSPNKFEVTGLTFLSGAGTGTSYWMLFRTRSSPTPDVMSNNTYFHDNHFFIKRRIVVAFARVYGVFSHNWVISQGQYVHCYYTQLGYGGNGGNDLWADYPWFGTDQFWFIENNYINNPTTVIKGVTDCEGVTRTVVRYNQTSNCYCADHGTEGGTSRGCRASEWYNNIILYPTINMTTADIGMRSGNKLIHNNLIKKNTVTNLGVMAYFRGFSGGGSGQWQSANGESVWDKSVNSVDTSGVNNGGGYPGLDQSKQSWIDPTPGGAPPPLAYTFDSGTASIDDSVSTGGYGYMTDNTKSWATDCWIGYTIVDMHFATKSTDGQTFTDLRLKASTGTFTSASIGKDVSGTNIQPGTTIVSLTGGSGNEVVLSLPTTGTGSGLTWYIYGQELRGGWIVSNTNIQIKYTTYSSNADRGGGTHFKAGDAYKIHRVLKALDCAGSGKCDQITVSGGIALNMTYSPPVSAYLHHLQEPTFCWNNTNTITGADLPLRANETPGGAGFYCRMGDNSGPDTPNPVLDIYNLGYDPAWVTGTPQKVLNVLTATINGTGKPYVGPFQYPHPIASGTITTVASVTMAIASPFPNTLVGQTSQLTLTVTNAGNTSVTITSVAYPTTFTGATTGFTLANSGDSRAITVTFTPVAGVLYTGNIVASGTMTDGSGTVAIQGLGVAGGGGGTVPPSKLRFMLE